MLRYAVTYVPEADTYRIWDKYWREYCTLADSSTGENNPLEFETETGTRAWLEYCYANGVSLYFVDAEEAAIAYELMEQFPGYDIWRSVMKSSNGPEEYMPGDWYASALDRPVTLGGCKTLFDLSVEIEKEQDRIERAV